MMNKFLLSLPLSLFPLLTLGAQSYYCPQNSAFIYLGMTQDQVTAACGNPHTVAQSNQPAYQKIPVLQLMYNNQGAQHAFYGVWSLPVSVNGGAQLEIDVVNDKVNAVRINGSGTNAFSLCQGANIEIGDPVASVYNACGTPSIVNNTYINQLIPGKKEQWIYQPTQYGPSLTLNFVDGKLQTIDSSN